MAAMLLGAIQPVLAQSGVPWRPAQRVPEYDDLARPPFLVADRNRTVHAFNPQSLGSDGTAAIFYRQWTLSGGWTSPIDIILPRDPGLVQILGVALDRSGWLHLIYFVGDPTRATVYYSRAPAANAASARAWQRPEAVGPSAGPQPVGAIAIDEHGRLVVVYGGKGDGHALYFTQSADGGSTWSSPALAARVYLPDDYAWGLRSTWDAKGNLHLVWSVVNPSGRGDEVWYMNLAADGLRWSQPVLLADRDPEEYSTNWASIVDYQDQLIVMYQDSFPATRWMRRSLDGGRTWTDPVRPFPDEGEYEFAVLLVDSGNVLHMILGNRTVNPEIHGMWHTTWMGNGWDQPQPIISGPQRADFDPSSPQAVISQGNVLLATWRTDTAVLNRNGAWYSYGTLAAPELPVEPLPVPAVMAVSTVQMVARVQEALPTAPVIATPQPFGLQRTEGSEPAQGLALATVLASVPVLLLILLTSAAGGIIRRLRS